jgi:CubicO group peptidase (beta-lactamase class C family)
MCLGANSADCYDLVQERVLERAAMADTGFVRSDQLPAGAAIGYLTDGRSNVLHLPVRGAGDGGAYSTLADLEALWLSLFAERIVPPPVVEPLVEARSDVAADQSPLRPRVLAPAGP